MFSKALLSIALLLTTIVLNSPSVEARHGNHCGGNNGFRMRGQANLSPQTTWMARNNVPFKRARRMTGDGFNRYDRQMYRSYKNDNCGGWRSNNARAYYGGNRFCNTSRHDNGRRVAGRFSRRWF